MLQDWTILLVAFGYLAVLFALASWGDRRAAAGRSLISNPYIYALSLAVFCTAWTFYGSVGRAASTGIGFLPVYLGPTLMAPLWVLVLRKIIRISKTYRITSIADFVASRYGKSTTLGGTVTVIAVLGIVPYISLQLKAISASFQIISGMPAATSMAPGPVPVWADQTLHIALLLAVFIILYGTRHLEATERHEGMVAAIAFESLVKLVAFLAVGVFVTFVLYDGPADVFTQARAQAPLEALFTTEAGAYPYGTWVLHTLLSMLAILFLPRQFHVAVVENVDEAHVQKAVWLFPLYLFAINLFVLPIAFGGLLHFPGGQVDADTFVLTLPLAEGQSLLALFVFIGGLAAATGMVIVATIALSTMLCNDLVMPVLLRIPALRLTERRDLTGWLLGIRRGSIVIVLVLGYVYFRFIAGAYTLVSIGLISFAAVAQFAPAILGGIFWKRGARRGALWGLMGGFAVWAYTLPLPTLAEAGLLPMHLVTDGPLGLALLRPYALFGLDTLDPISHAVFWSLLVNAGLYVGLSLFARPSVIEHSQAVSFVDVFRYSDVGRAVWRGTAHVRDLQQLLRRFLGTRRADDALAAYAREHALDWAEAPAADAALVQYAETLLAGAIGAASARVMVATVVKEEPLRMREVMDILDETQQVIAYSRALEQKSRALEAATAELQAANTRLQELDRLKDDFVATVTHELRTPLTSVRAFAEILHDHAALDPEQRQQFLRIIIKESERLTRLINQVLDFQKIESGTLDWHVDSLDLSEVIREAAETMSRLFDDKGAALTLDVPAWGPQIMGDRDRIMQVLLNLLSNAVKFCAAPRGTVHVALRSAGERVQVDVRDDGPGIRPEDQRAIFEKFRQVEHSVEGRPAGSGLGLAIAQRIVAHHGGRIWVTSTPGEGATFSFTLPKAGPPAGTAPAAHRQTPAALSPS